MRAFKKRTIALVLASVVTVVGAFASENYKNSLMGLDFKTSPEGVHVVLETRLAQESMITPLRRDANTYILTLPEVDSKVVSPDLSNAPNISSVDIRTMPYSNTSKGYTRITIKTAGVNNLTANTKLFLPSSSASRKNVQKTNSATQKELERKRRQQLENARLQKPQVQEFQSETVEESVRNVSQQEKTQAGSAAQVMSGNKTETVSKVENFNASDIISKNSYIEEEESSNKFLLILAIITLCGLIAFFYERAKNKMHEMTGERFVIDVSDEADKQKSDKSKEKSPKIKKIKSAIRNLDNAYSKTAVPVKLSKELPIDEVPVVEQQSVETVNVVDLDEIFKEQTKTQSVVSEEDEENAALEEFLSGFSFDEEFIKAELEANSPGYDEEFYEKLINDKNQRFSNDDIEKICKLMNVEIQDSTIREIDKYLVSNPIKKVPSRAQILEDLVTSYAVSQDIIFTRDDIGALYKLINVEIDPEFITDLRTNPLRLQEMQEEMKENKERTRKPSEILTLNVKDVLPDLSEALRKQGNRAIESEVKPQTVYFSEGYEVSKLTVEEELPNLAAEVNNKAAYATKPSASYDLVDNNYDVKKLMISSQLPDLTEMLKNPDKYSKPEPEEVEVDADALLSTINNVQFKPFYDGEPIEVLNNAEDFIDSTQDEIQAEMLEFAEVLDLDKKLVADSEIAENKDDFEEIAAKELEIIEDVKPEQVIKAESEQITEQKPVRKVPEKTDLLRRIRERIKERPIRENSVAKQSMVSDTKVIADIKCIFEGESYTVVSSAHFIGKAGCYLAKNEKGYIVLGYYGDKLVSLRQYEALKSEKIQARISEKLPDDTNRFLVRIGIHKFVVDVVNGEEIKYVMDLC